MFVSYRSTEEAIAEAVIDRDFILGLRGNTALVSMVLNPSTSKITPTYKDYLDHLVMEVGADHWNFRQLEDQSYQIILVWEDHTKKQKVA